MTLATYAAAATPAITAISTAAIIAIRTTATGWNDTLEPKKL